MRYLLLCAFTSLGFLLAGQSNKLVVINYTNVSELIEAQIYLNDSITVVSYLIVNEDTMIRDSSFQNGAVSLDSGESLLEVVENCFDSGLVKDLDCDADVRDLNESVFIVEEFSRIYSARQVNYRNVFGKCQVKANDNFYKIRAIIYRIKESIQ